jgi:hypothetical protein
MKKIIAIVLILSFITTFSAFAISKNEPFKKLSRGLDNIVYGGVEVPDNINETGTKGQKAFKDCTDDTNDDVGRGIVRLVGGLLELATFWYPTE